MTDFEEARKQLSDDLLRIAEEEGLEVKRVTIDYDSSDLRKKLKEIDDFERRSRETAKRIIVR